MSAALRWSAREPEGTRRRGAIRTVRGAAYVLLAAYTVLVFVPFAWSLVTSFKTLPDSLGLGLVPHPFTTYGYQRAFTQLNPGLPVLLSIGAVVVGIDLVGNVEPRER